MSLGRGWGWPRYTTWAPSLQLALRELQYVLQCIVIRKNIDYKQLVLVCFLEFLVALLQNTTRVTTATTMATAGGNGPLVPHMRPCAPRQRFK
jgi:hypothetical protein